MNNRDKKRYSFEEYIGKKASWMQKWRKKGILWETVIVVGAIGWMVALPMVIGGYVGSYIDRNMQVSTGGVSWTVTFILLGLFIALYSVWRVFIYKR
ncbi:MAG: AtpZ/AtpI family protein [Helicobacteraceae bacterium]|nr:AtpZ/AtpI family protein [Helicobacteraceae bacterium]